MVLSGPPKPGGFWIKLKREKMQSDFTNKCIMNVKFPVTTPFGFQKNTRFFVNFRILYKTNTYMYIHIINWNTRGFMLLRSRYRYLRYNPPSCLWWSCISSVRTKCVHTRNVRSWPDIVNTPMSQRLWISGLWGIMLQTSRQLVHKLSLGKSFLTVDKTLSPQWATLGNTEKKLQEICW